MWCIAVRLRDCGRVDEIVCRRPRLGLAQVSAWVVCRARPAFLGDPCLRPPLPAGLLTVGRCLFWPGSGLDLLIRVCLGRLPARASCPTLARSGPRLPAGPCPAGSPPPRRPSPLRPVPTLARTFARGGYGTGIESDRARRDSVEANGRFINHLPGCRQVTILTPLAARLLLPDSRAFGLETFWL